jgi:hypothetical protein
MSVIISECQRLLWRCVCDEPNQHDVVHGMAGAFSNVVHGNCCGEGTKSQIVWQLACRCFCVPAPDQSGLTSFLHAAASMKGDPVGGAMFFLGLCNLFSRFRYFRSHSHFLTNGVHLSDILFSVDVLCSLRSDRCCPLRQGRRPERPGPPALQRVRRHLLQGQRRRCLRRLGSRSQPLGLLLQPLLNVLYGMSGCVF